MNLPQQLQEYLNYKKLQIIDANTGLPEDEKEFDALGQSALISFLTGMYKATRTKDNIVVINSKSDATGLLKSIFVDLEKVLDNIATFSRETTIVAKEKIEAVSAGFINYLEQIGTAETETPDFLQNLMTSQRHEILKYLPAGLKLGDLLNDDTLEDESNKMEGPISSLMHKIENSFSTSD